MKVWSLHGMGLREWRGRRGPCVSGRLEQSALQWINRLKKCRSRVTMVLTLIGGSNTPFPPVYLAGTRAYLQVIRTRVSRRHPSDRPVHHRDKAFIELFIPTPKHDAVG